MSESVMAAPSATCLVQATTSSDHLNVRFAGPFVTVNGTLLAPVIPTIGTFWTYVPSVLPGFRPSDRNASSRYLTVSSSPLVPGARPSNSSADSALMRSSSGAASNFGIAVMATGAEDGAEAAATAGGVSDFEQAEAR